MLKPSGGAIVCGIIGNPVQHSLSPWMQQEFARQTGVDFLYAPFPVRAEELSNAIRGLQALGVRGINVTIPHKEAVLQLVDELSPRASAIGAVNTLLFDDGRIFGENTDVTGFARALRRHAGAVNGPSLVIGAGGAARAVLHALASEDATPIYLANRTLARAEALAADFPTLPIRPIVLSRSAITPLLGDLQLLVNTSSRGLQGENYPEIHLDALPQSSIVCDIVYKPLQTPLLAAAQASGLRCVDGLGMLVEQGAESFRIWTGQLPDAGAVEELLRKWLPTPKLRH
ncbi:shikimate dehydrogenase [Acidithiobacillus sp. IBUN Pt1247-S3]|uniref:shikimate dehydrogenase n=1 Tax=Acidithiobacillus sp. IBUN Pt1247-S3 TaxID=3166642 RepID=UPI0034E4D441